MMEERACLWSVVVLMTMMRKMILLTGKPNASISEGDLCFCFDLRHLKLLIFPRLCMDDIAKIWALNHIVSKDFENLTSDPNQTMWRYEWHGMGWEGCCGAGVTRGRGLKWCLWAICSCLSFGIFSGVTTTEFISDKSMTCVIWTPPTAVQKMNRTSCCWLNPLWVALSGEVGQTEGRGGQEKLIIPASYTTPSSVFCNPLNFAY